MKSRRWITLVFAAVVLSFVAATAFVHLKLRAVDDGALGISTNTAPSIERLADARAELRHLQLRLEEPAETRAIQEAQRALDDRVNAYLALPISADERELWTRVLMARAHLDEAVAFGSRPEIAAATSELHDALTSSIRGNATHTMQLASDIKAFRERATLLAVVLDVGCVLMAIGAALFVRGVVREQDRRANELEAFAGRVAHDILGPLNTVSFALELVSQPSGERQRVKLSERGLAALDRTKSLVSGLLDFARAGGHPQPDAKAYVRETIEAVVAGLQPVAEGARAELEQKTDTDAVVACNPGVLTSVVSNLANNALKYLGDAETRRVEIRAHERATSVRIEVEDTGPGIAKDIGADLFEPYVRAKGAREPGLGLGLATVKRLVEGHRGAVGVDSVPGRGSIFWFELPKAEKVLTAV